MKGPQIAGLIIGLVIIIVAIIVIVILLKKKNKSTKSQEVVVDNGKVQSSFDYSKKNIWKIFDDATRHPITKDALEKASRLYGGVRRSELEEKLESKIPYYYIDVINDYNSRVYKYFPQSREQPGWVNKKYIKDEKEETILSPDVFSYVLYDTINNDLKDVYMGPNADPGFKPYKSLDDFLVWHVGAHGTDEVVNQYYNTSNPNGTNYRRKVYIDVDNDEILDRLSQLKDTYDSFRASPYDNFDEYLKDTQNLESIDEARKKADAIIQVLTRSPYEDVTEEMIVKWNDINDTEYRTQFKHPAIYALSQYL